MKRKIYLEGEIGDRFVKEFEADVTSYKDAMKLLEANFPDLKQYLVDCHEKGIGFTFETEGAQLEKEEDFILPVAEGDITIYAVPAGSKSGTAKIVAAILIIAFLIINPTSIAGGANLLTAELTGAAAFGVNVALAISVNLAITGIMQLMAPDPGADSDAPQAYLFNGSQQNIIEGDPVPILYGELRVPGRPIGFGVISGSNEFNPVTNFLYDFTGLQVSTGPR